MNNARIWCVVRPTVGIPLIIGGTALGSLAIHASVLITTDWFAESFQRGGSASASLSTGTNVAARVMEGTPVAGQEATLVMPDGSTVKVKFEAPATSNADGETTLASVTLPERN